MTSNGASRFSTCVAIALDEHDSSGRQATASKVAGRRLALRGPCAGALDRRLSVHSDEETEHDRIATTVQEVVQKHWELEALSFHAGKTVQTYQRLERLD